MKRDTIGPDDCPVYFRWRIFYAGPRWPMVALHHFLPDRDDEDPHDHPRSFVTVILRGHYYDEVEGQPPQLMCPGMIRYRRAQHEHITRIGPRGCWTLVFMSRTKRSWGYKRQGLWWPWHAYMQRFGWGNRCEEEH